MKNVILCVFLPLNCALLAWNFAPSVDLSCDPHSPLLSSSFLLAYPKFPELVIGGLSFGPLAFDGNSVSATLLSKPFDSCFTAGSLSGTATPNTTITQSWDITGGDLPLFVDLQWRVTVTLQSGKNDSRVFNNLVSTQQTSNFPPPCAQLRPLLNNSTSVALQFDQPVLLRSADPFVLSAGVSVQSFQRVSALQYALDLSRPSTFQVVAVVLPPLEGPFGAESMLGKAVVPLGDSSQPSHNPPLLLSEDLGYFRANQTVLLVVFGTSVSGNLSSCFNFSTQGPQVDKVVMLESPEPGSFRVSLQTQGEGTFSVSLNAGCVTVGGSPSLAANINLTRDVTPPTLDFQSLQGNLTHNSSFDVQLTASEPIYVDPRALVLRTASGSGSIPAGRMTSDTRFLASVENIVVDTDGVAVLLVEVPAASVADRAGNAGPADRLGVTVRALGRATSRAPTPGFAPPASGTDSTIQWVLIALAVLAVGLILVYVVSKRRHKQVWAPRNYEEEFEDYGIRIFEQYAGPEQEYMTFDDIVRHSQSRGYPTAEAERGAKVLIRAAGSGDKISREEWMQWLRRKVTRGQTPNVDHLRELRAVFPL